MDWGIVSTVAIALIGGTGAAGLFSGSIELTRQNRLRRSIKKTAELLDLLPGESPARASLSYAADLESARYLALKLVGYPRLLGGSLKMNGLLALVLVVVSSIVLLVLNPDLRPSGRAGMSTSPSLSQWIGLSLLVLSVIASISICLLSTLSARRIRFVYRVLSSPDPARVIRRYRKSNSSSPFFGKETAYSAFVVIRALHVRFLQFKDR